MGKLEATAEALAATLEPEDQVLVICGRTKLARQARGEEVAGEDGRPGFVNNMNEYMSACDCVTPSGTGTIAEALISGLPVLLNGFIPCREAGNVSFVLENGVGAYEEEPAKMAEIVREWFQTEGALEEMSRRAKRLGRGGGHRHRARARGDGAVRGEGGKGREGKERGRREARR